MLLIKDLSKSFSDVSPTLCGINLHIQKGQFCVIIGSNGSGKSTLLKTISGEHQVDMGSIFISEKDVTDMPIHKRSMWISSVTQDISKGTIEHMTLLENIMLSLMRSKKSTFAFYSHDTKPIIKAIQELNLGLETYLHSPLGTLSGGQRQAIATLMAILSNPDILLLDEHTSALDPKIQQKLMKYTASKIKENGLTSLMVTHNLSDALRYGDRLIMIHRGKIVMDVSDKSFLDQESLLQKFHEYEDDILLEGERV